MLQPRFLEERQVTLYLPVGHDGVPGVELLALDLRVVVDVIAVGRLAQRLAQHAVGHQFVRRMQQGRRQGPDPAAGDLPGRQQLQGVTVGLRPGEGAVDAVPGPGPRASSGWANSSAPDSASQRLECRCSPDPVRLKNGFGMKVAAMPAWCAIVCTMYRKKISRSALVSASE